MVRSPDDDPIARDVLSDDPERRARVLNPAPVSRLEMRAKLRILGALGICCTVAVVLLSVLRAGRLRLLLDVTDPLAASVAATVILAVGLKYYTIGGVGLVVVDYLRRHRPVTESRAQRLFGIEETMGIVGLGIGGLGTLVGVGLLAVLALADVEFVRTWLAGATRPIPLPLSYGVLVGWSTTVGVGLFAASAVTGTSGE